MHFTRKLLKGTVLALVVAIGFSAIASAQFIGPSGQPPNGGGALFISTSSRAIVINTSTIYSANPLAFQIATSTFTGTVTAAAFIGPFSGSVSAANITGPSAFGSNYGTYSYAFPGALAIGTSTTTGLPTDGLFVSGALGVGTLTPAQALEVVGNIKISGTSNGIIFPDGTVQTTAGGGGGGDSVWSATSTGIFYNGGQVSIGTSTPTATLEIVTPALATRETLLHATVSDAPGYQFGIKNTTLTNGVFEPAFYGTAAASGRHALIFQAMTTSDYDTGTTALMSFFSLRYTGHPVTGSFSNLTVRPLFAWGNQSGYKMVMSKDGYLSIATSTAPYPLTVNGVIASISGGFRFPDGTVQTTAGGGGSSQWTTTSTGIFYDGGRVGIGTDTPAQALETVGNIKITGTSNGIIFPDGTVQTTAGGGGSSQWTTTSTGIFYSSGRVGIGTTAPAQALETVGNIKITGASNGIIFPDGTTQTTAGGGGSSQWTTTSTGIFYSDGAVGIGMNPSSDALSILGNVYASGGLFTSDSTGVNYMMGKLALGAASAGTAQLYVNGNVGIGTTAPGAKLEISTGASTHAQLRITGAYNTTSLGAELFLREYNASDYGFKVGLDSNTNSFYLRSVFTTTENDRLVIERDTGEIGIGTASPSYLLDVSGTFRATGNWSLGGGAQTALNMNAQNITGVAKLSVATIDPLYEIKGTKYSTYAPSIAGGVKEEYIGSAETEGTYSVIDFNKLKEGSDLWVWRSVVDFSKDTVQVFTTPIGKPAAVSYRIDGNRIVFESSEPVEFSYRLIGNRYDWKDHPTYAQDQTEETILKIK